MTSDDKPHLDPTTLLVFGQVIHDAAEQMNMDDVTEQFRDGFREGGRLLMGYGMLLLAGFSEEDLKDFAQRALLRRKEADIKKMKDLLGE